MFPASDLTDDEGDTWDLLDMLDHIRHPRAAVPLNKAEQRDYLILSCWLI